MITALLAPCHTQTCIVRLFERDAALLVSNMGDCFLVLVYRKHLQAEKILMYTSNTHKIIRKSQCT